MALTIRSIHKPDDYGFSFTTGVVTVEDTGTEVFDFAVIPNSLLNVEVRNLSANSQDIEAIVLEVSDTDPFEDEDQLVSDSAVGDYDAELVSDAVSGQTDFDTANSTLLRVNSDDVTPHAIAPGEKLRFSVQLRSAWAVALRLRSASGDIDVVVKGTVVYGGTD